MIAIIEMPKNTTYKYEIKDNEHLLLTRVVNTPVPCNYGYIPDTLSGDGDPLDVFVISKDPILPFTKVNIELLGVVNCLDQHENDEKLIARIEGDTHVSSYSYRDIVNYLQTYKTGMKILEVNYSKEKALEVLGKAKQNYGEK